MEWAEVAKRIEEGEGRRTAFQRQAEELAGIGKAICAFANSDGGLIVLGVDDTGRAVGVRDDPEAVQERLTGFLHTGCSVPVSARCGTHRVPDGWIHWIDVPRQMRRFEPLHYRGRYWIRRERSSVEPSASERQELFNNFGFVLTEEQIIRAATPADIDVVEFQSFLRAQGLETEAEPQPASEVAMRNFRVLEEGDGSLHPTLYGLMTFGKAPQAHPQTTSFLIRCAAYAGKDRATDVISAADSRGRLDEQVEHAVGWLRSLGWQERYEGLLRYDTPLVPDLAIREALVNAVIHREYAVTGASVMLEVFSDRIEITSPGNLPNRMRVENVKAGGGPKSRNESMANAMVVKRMMERRGRGWPVMRQALRLFNGTEPELLNDEGGRYVRVTFRLVAGSSGRAE